MWSDFFLQAYTYLEPGGVVMIPLILTSVWMWTLIIERLIWFARLSKLDISLGQALQSAHSGRLPEGASGLRTDVVRFFLNERTGRRDVDILLGVILDSLDKIFVTLVVVVAEYCHLPSPPSAPPNEPYFIGLANRTAFIRCSDSRTPPCLRASSMRILQAERSEERRVGKECRSRWSPYH